MFTAKLEDGTTISLVDPWQLEELKALREKKAFFCPLCKNHLHLKLGSQRQWHFAHNSKVSCHTEYENETMYHLDGKRQLYEWLKDKNIEVALEVYLPLIRQRPDILFRFKNKLYALEYQCAPIDPRVLLQRTQGYKELGITPLWILGGNRFKRHSAYTYSIQAFEWYAVRRDEDNFPFITYFCPNDKRITQLKQLTPYTKTRMIALHDSTPLKNITNVTNIITPHLRKKLPFDHWLTIRKTWRYQRPARYPSKTDLFIQKNFYRHKIPLSFFPVEAGWPTTDYHFIETTPRYWQSYLLLECLQYQPINQFFSSQIIKSCLQPYLNNRIFTNRQIDEPYGWTKAVDGYLEWLCQLEYLERGTESYTYKRLRDVTIPTSTNEAVHIDRNVYFQSLEKSMRIGHNKEKDHSKLNVSQEESS